MLGILAVGILAVVILVTAVNIRLLAWSIVANTSSPKRRHRDWGLAFLNHLNYGRGYATGGAVGSIPSTGYRPMARR